MSFFSLKNKGEFVALFDVGSGSVGAAIAFIPKKAKNWKFDPLTLGLEAQLAERPTILASVRVPIVMNQELDYEMYLFETGRALGEAALRIARFREVAPAKAFSFLAAPWYQSQTRKIKLRKSVPFTISKRLVDDLIDKEVRSFEQIQMKSYEHSGEKMRLLEKRIMQVKLNGFKQTAPFGKRAKELELDIFLAISPEATLEALSYQINKSFNVPVQFESFLFPAFAVCRDGFPDNKDFLLLDVAGEMTDLGFVRNEVLEETITYPNGKNLFIREIARDLDQVPGEASSLFALHLSRHADQVLAYRLSKVLAPAKMRWLQGFQEALGVVSIHQLIPPKVLILSDPEIGTFLKELILLEDFHQYTLTENKFNATILSAAEVGEFVRFAQGVPRDLFMMIETIFINKII